MTVAQRGVRKYREKIDRFLKNVLFQADGRERLGLLSASERSERDTYRGKNEKIGDVCLFIYIYVWTYVCHFVL